MSTGTFRASVAIVPIDAWLSWNEEDGCYWLMAIGPYPASVLQCFCASVLLCFSSYCPYCLYTVVDDLLAIGYWLLVYWLMDTYVPIDLLSYTDEAGLM